METLFWLFVLHKKNFIQPHGLKVTQKDDFFFVSPPKFSMENKEKQK